MMIDQQQLQSQQNQTKKFKIPLKITQDELRLTINLISNSNSNETIRDDTSYLADESETRDDKDEEKTTKALVFPSLTSNIASNISVVNELKAISFASSSLNNPIKLMQIKELDEHETDQSCSREPDGKSDDVASSNLVDNKENCCQDDTDVSNETKRSKRSRSSHKSNCKNMKTVSKRARCSGNSTESETTRSSPHKSTTAQDTSNEPNCELDDQLIETDESSNLKDSLVESKYSKNLLDKFSCFGKIIKPRKSSTEFKYENILKILEDNFNTNQSELNTDKCKGSLANDQLKNFSRSTRRPFDVFIWPLLSLSEHAIIRFNNYGASPVQDLKISSPIVVTDSHPFNPSRRNSQLALPIQDMKHFSYIDSVNSSDISTTHDTNELVPKQCSRQIPSTNDNKFNNRRPRKFYERFFLCAFTDSVNNSDYDTDIDQDDDDQSMKLVPAESKAIKQRKKSLSNQDHDSYLTNRRNVVCQSIDIFDFSTIFEVEKGCKCATRGAKSSSKPNPKLKKSTENLFFVKQIIAQNNADLSSYIMPVMQISNTDDDYDNQLLSMNGKHGDPKAKAFYNPLQAHFKIVSNKYKNMLDSPPNSQSPAHADLAGNTSTPAKNDLVVESAIAKAESLKRTKSKRLEKNGQSAKRFGLCFNWITTPKFDSDDYSSEDYIYHYNPDKPMDPIDKEINLESPHLKPVTIRPPSAPPSPPPRTYSLPGHEKTQVKERPDRSRNNYAKKSSAKMSASSAVSTSGFSSSLNATMPTMNKSTTNTSQSNTNATMAGAASFNCSTDNSNNSIDHRISTLSGGSGVSSNYVLPNTLLGVNNNRASSISNKKFVSINEEELDKTALVNPSLSCASNRCSQNETIITSAKGQAYLLKKTRIVSSVGCSSTTDSLNNGNDALSSKGPVDHRNEYMRLDRLKNEIERTMNEMFSLKNELGNLPSQGQVQAHHLVDAGVNTDISMSNAVFKIKYEDEEEDDEDHLNYADSCSAILDDMDDRNFGDLDQAGFSANEDEHLVHQVGPVGVVHSCHNDQILPDPIHYSDMGRLKMSLSTSTLSTRNSPPTSTTVSSESSSHHHHVEMVQVNMPKITCSCPGFLPTLAQSYDESQKAKRALEHPGPQIVGEADKETIVNNYKSEFKFFESPAVNRFDWQGDYDSESKILDDSKNGLDSNELPSGASKSQNNSSVEEQTRCINIGLVANSNSTLTDEGSSRTVTRIGRLLEENKRELSSLKSSFATAATSPNNNFIIPDEDIDADEDFAMQQVENQNENLSQNVDHVVPVYSAASHIAGFSPNLEIKYVDDSHHQACIISSNFSQLANEILASKPSSYEDEDDDDDEDDFCDFDYKNLDLKGRLEASKKMFRKTFSRETHMYNNLGFLDERVFEESNDESDELKSRDAKLKQRRDDHQPVPIVTVENTTSNSLSSSLADNSSNKTTTISSNREELERELSLNNQSVLTGKLPQLPPPSRMHNHPDETYASSGSSTDCEEIMFLTSNAEEAKQSQYQPLQRDKPTNFEPFIKMKRNQVIEQKKSKPKHKNIQLIESKSDDDSFNENRDKSHQSTSEDPSMRNDASSAKPHEKNGTRPAKETSPTVPVEHHKAAAVEIHSFSGSKPSVFKSEISSTLETNFSSEHDAKQSTDMSYGTNMSTELSQPNQDGTFTAPPTKEEFKLKLLPLKRSSTFDNTFKHRKVAAQGTVITTTSASGPYSSSINNFNCHHHHHYHACGHHHSGHVCNGGAKCFQELIEQSPAYPTTSRPGCSQSRSKAYQPEAGPSIHKSKRTEQKHFHSSLQNQNENYFPFYNNSSNSCYCCSCSCSQNACNAMNCPYMCHFCELNFNNMYNLNAANLVVENQNESVLKPSVRRSTSHSKVFANQLKKGSAKSSSQHVSRQLQKNSSNFQHYQTNNKPATTYYYRSATARDHQPKNEMGGRMPSGPQISALKNVLDDYKLPGNEIGPLQPAWVLPLTQLGLCQDNDPELINGQSQPKAHNSRALLNRKQHTSRSVYLANKYYKNHKSETVLSRNQNIQGSNKVEYRENRLKQLIDDQSRKLLQHQIEFERHSLMLKEFFNHNYQLNFSAAENDESKNQQPTIDKTVLNNTADDVVTAKNDASKKYSLRRNAATSLGSRSQNKPDVVDSNDSLKTPYFVSQLSSFETFQSSDKLIKNQSNYHNKLSMKDYYLPLGQTEKSSSLNANNLENEAEIKEYLLLNEIRNATNSFHRPHSSLHLNDQHQNSCSIQQISTTTKTIITKTSPKRYFDRSLAPGVAKDSESNQMSYQEKPTTSKNIYAKRSSSNMGSNQNYVIRYPTPTRNFQKQTSNEVPSKKEEIRSVNLTNNSSGSNLTTSYDGELQLTENLPTLVTLQRSLTEVTLNSYKLPKTSKSKKKRSGTPATGMAANDSDPKLK